MSMNPIESVAGFGAGAAIASIARATKGGGEYWSRVVAAADLTRTNPARSMDSALFVTMAAGTYEIRGKYFMTAFGGGPSLVHRLNGPALTLMLIRRAVGGGVVTGTAITPAWVCKTIYDVADTNTAMNTDGLTECLAIVEFEGLVMPSAAGDWGMEWTGSNGTFGITRRAGSYLEYRKL
jgi:hypothetical protein